MSNGLRYLLNEERKRINKMSKEEFKGVRDRDKRFLNDSHYEFGTVSWNVSTYQYSERDYTVNADLRMSDCGDVINLEFGSSADPKSSEKRMDKLDTLIESLQKFRSVLQQAHDFQLENNKPE